MNKTFNTIVMAAVLSVAIACSESSSEELTKYDLVKPCREMTVRCDARELDYKVYFNSRHGVDSVIYYNSDGSFRFGEYNSHDSRGRLSQTLAINSENETEARYTYEYNGDFISRFVIYGMNNEDLMTMLNTNDGKHIIRSEVYDSGELSHTTTYRWEDEFHCIEKSVDAQGGHLGKASYRYYAKNRPEWIEVDDGTMIAISYNDHGLPAVSQNVLLSSTQEFAWDSGLDEDPIRFYDYEFDPWGNWSVRREYPSQNRDSCLVITRSFVY